MRFAADENFNGDLLKGLQARLPDLDIVRVQDTQLYQEPDPKLLAWLAEEARILLTHDAKTMPGHAYDRVQDGLPMPGVVIVRETTTMGHLLDDLETLIGAGSPADFENIVQFVPL